MRNNSSFIAIVTLCLLLAFGILFFAYTKTRDILSGPRITISSPLSGKTVDDQAITLEGTAENVSWLRLNGRQIYTDEKNHFKEKLLLSYGYNILEVQGEDRFGKKQTVTTELILR